MSSEPESRLSLATPGGETPSGSHEDLAVGAELDPPWDARLDAMPLQLEVSVKVRAFRVGDLLALQRGSVVETLHEHAQEVPVRCGGTVLMWAEFEVIDQRLAVRVTRLA